jgi:cold shock CspA family protein
MEGTKSTILEGVIKKVLNKWFGFIQADWLPEDLFFHFTAFEWGTDTFNSLREWQKVSFEIWKGSKPGTKQAINIKLID